MWFPKPLPKTCKIQKEKKGGRGGGLEQIKKEKDLSAMNCAARLVCKAPKSEHVTPLLVDLHWLPVERWIVYKIATICNSVITGTAPPHLSNLLGLYILSRTLHSSADTRIFRIPNRRKRFHGQHAFSFMTCSNFVCLQIPAENSPFFFFLSSTPIDLSSLEHVLSNLGNMWACMCACVRACVCVRVCVKVEGEWC